MTPTRDLAQLVAGAPVAARCGMPRPVFALRRQVADHDPRPLWPALLAIAVAVSVWWLHAWVA